MLGEVGEGMRENRHAKAVSGAGPPHLICETNDGTPFYLNLNPSDVGHAAIWGPTGAGKSTLLNLLEAQFFKYPGARVIVFDKGKSARQPCMACGGLYYEPASDSKNGVVFQPLRDLETRQDKTFAVEFIQTLLAMQRLTAAPAMSKAIMDAVLLMEEIPKRSRTLTTFAQNCNYIDEDTGKNTVCEYLQPYLLTGQYGKIFDNDASELSDDTDYLVIEMEYLMNLGEAATAPALVYLFYFIEKRFDGSLTMLVLDEAWLFLQNPLFQKKINEWLKTLRKKNVFVVFATQDVMDAVKSPLFSTIAQQCLTKIYLADPQAADASLYEAYGKFGLDDTEIHRIAGAEMKRDYYYTSPLGSRLFQLGLGPVTLGLIAGADQSRLDKLSDMEKTSASGSTRRKYLVIKAFLTNICFRRITKNRGEGIMGRKRIIFALLVLCGALSGCKTTTRTAETEYSGRWERTRGGMSLEEFREVWPEAKWAGETPDGRSIYMDISPFAGPPSKGFDYFLFEDDRLLRSGMFLYTTSWFTLKKITDSSCSSVIQPESLKPERGNENGKDNNGVRSGVLRGVLCGRARVRFGRRGLSVYGEPERRRYDNRVPGS
jgi:energy-coupling factor transporter ATP-binding protein EcfA2